jgi:hypothetical protein
MCALSPVQVKASEPWGWFAAELTYSDQKFYKPRVQIQLADQSF